MKINAAGTITLLLAAVLSETEATAGKIVVEEGDTKFSVTSFDDGRSKPYKIKYKKDGIVNSFLFTDEGLVRIVAVGSEKYKAVYNSLGRLTKVKVLSSGRRYLKEQEEEDNAEQFVERAALGRRRLYDCVDCYDAWELVCSTGHESVCELEFLDTDLLSDTALGAIDTMCDSFELLCNTLGGGTACEDQCDCIPALQISLEWFDAGDLDLVVTEPTGAVVSQANPSGVFGFIDNDNTAGPGYDPENYFVTSGLFGSDMLGDYHAYVNVYSLSSNASWELTASVDGTVVWTEQGMLNPDDVNSETFNVTLSEYQDNQCTNSEFNVVENVGGKRV